MRKLSYISSTEDVWKTLKRNKNSYDKNSNDYKP